MNTVNVAIPINEETEADSEGSNQATAIASTILAEPLISHHCDSWLAEHGDALIAFRRYLHAHPEISGEEYGTATLIAERLSAAGLAPRLIEKGTGVICDIGSGDRVIALRADIDALPLQDVKDVPYRSTVAGVCHACGHDVHATVILGAALVLAELGDLLPGRTRFIFQPSEEAAPCGSHDIIAAGGMENVSEIYGLHCYPPLPAGEVGLKVGPLTAACTMVQIKLAGSGGHTARPQLTVDMVGALGRIVTEVPQLVGRRFDARSGLSVVFGAIHAGVAGNIIPQHGSVIGTIRTLDTTVWREVPAVFDEIVRQVVAPTGAEIEIEFPAGIPPVENDEHAVSVFTTAAQQVLPADAVHPAPHSMGGEDFAWYLQHVPGAIVRLGVSRPGECLDLHRPDFDIDESAIEHGVRLMVHTALEAHRR